MATALDVAKRANVMRLILYHHDPDRSDDALDRIGADAQQQANAFRTGLQVIVAREGSEIVF